MNERQKDYKYEIKIFFEVQDYAIFNDNKDCLPNADAFHPRNDYLEYLLIIKILGDF